MEIKTEHNNPEFVKHYLIAMLWASTDSEGEPLDSNYGPEHISQPAREQAEKDCHLFLSQAKEAGVLYCVIENIEQAGHDFWLARNRHGAGFWDRACYDAAGNVNALDLTCLAETQGELSCYVGDDGNLYTE